MSLPVGLTGGVACGKSTIGKLFEKRGALVLRTDEVAHSLMQDPAIFNRIVERFGSEVIGDFGQINRSKLAALAFNGRIQELNEILHPAVIAEQRRWRGLHPGSILIVEAALLLECNLVDDFCYLITVTCQPEQKIQRFAKRTGMSLEDARLEIERRSASQLPDAEKIAAADFVIDNSGDLAAAEAQVEKVWRELAKNAVPTVG